MEENVCDLEAKLSHARQSLTTLNDNIRRFVGRGLKDSRVDRYNPDSGTSKRNESNYDRNVPRKDITLRTNRRIHDSKIVVNRPSKEEDEDASIWLPTPRINSRVIRELPSREEIVEAQGIDSESRARNRRMFGSLLGTLQKFCQEESRLRKTEDKKAQIEKKLEKQQLQERELLQKERNSLYLDRKRKQLEIKCLENKMARVKDFKTWEHSMNNQKNQIQTKSKPHLLFQPRLNTPHTEQLILKRKIELDSLIERRRVNLQADLREIEYTNNMEEDEYGLDDSSNSNFYDAGKQVNESNIKTLLADNSEKSNHNWLTLEE
ncbi:pinin [Drosophila nasuta]|uniref:Pinin n=1 Tax=Drosophila albomicans TaxID=7291 RepID=A0A6P8XKE5_DROAB|nr:pinin [Drosophila albomicans]XP_060665400.1 pinin [Drosophila nasuta]